MVQQRQFRTLCVSLIALALAACEPTDNRLVRQEISGSTMGTGYSIGLVTNPGFVTEDLDHAIAERLIDLESSLSTYLPDSDLSRFNASNSTDWFMVSADLCAAVAHSVRLSEHTNGAFDITVGRLVELWGFGPGDIGEKMPEAHQISLLRDSSGFEKLSVDCTRPAIRKTDARVHIDLSAYAKGLAVDEISLLIREYGISSYLVEIGGEISAAGHSESGKSWRIAIESPHDFTRGIQLIVDASDLSIATSGNYRNFYVRDGNRFSHTIDPKTGKPVTHNLASVTVAAADAAYADALATALMVMGLNPGLEFANRHSLAALFLRFEGENVAESMTDEFRAMIVD